MIKQLSMWFAGVLLLGLGLVIGTQLDRLSGDGSSGSSTTRAAPPWWRWA